MNRCNQWWFRLNAVGHYIMNDGMKHPNLGFYIVLSIYYHRVFGFSCPPADSGVLEIKKIELIREIQKINIITNSDSNRTK
jgi:hypothetical protein